MNSKADLPDWVKKIPDHAQEVFMSAFNAAYGETHDDARAMKIAISAVKKAGYGQNKDGAWVKLEGGYLKEILYPGVFPHPQKPEQTIVMTMEKLEEIESNAQKFLKAGGKIPLTVSHPKSEAEKIDQTEGQVEDVFIDYAENKLMIRPNLFDKADKWVKDGKLQSVSPGLYHDVVTSAGKFPVLIDHVALTASPHLLAQGGFMPINAERYEGCSMFFENHAVSFVPESPLWDRVKSWLELKFGRVSQPDVKDQTSEKGDEMELKEAQDKISALEAENKQLKDNDVKVKADLETSNKKLAEYTDKETAALEAAKKTESEKFEARIDALIKAGKIKPANKADLVAQFEKARGLDAMEFEGKKVSIPDWLLERFEKAEPETKPVIDPHQISNIRIDKEIYDLNTPEGKTALTKAAELEAEKMRIAANDPKKDMYDFYVEAKKKILLESAVAEQE